MVQLSLFTEQCSAPNCTTSNQEETLYFDYLDKKRYCEDHIESCSQCNKTYYNGLYGEQARILYRFNISYCKECFNKNFINCPACSETVERGYFLPPTEYNRFGDRKKGGCLECSVSCNNCDRVVNKEYVFYEDDEYYCEDCHSELFFFCNSCGQVFDKDNSNYVEEVGEFCNTCYSEKYTVCSSCEKTVERSSVYTYDDQDFCENCFESYENEAKTYYQKYTDKFEEFTYNKNSRHLNQLKKILPISVKDLKKQHPKLAAGLQDLINFSNGKTLTEEIVLEYETTLEKEIYPVEYTIWENLQRSVQEDYPQLVISVQASEEFLNRLKRNPVFIDLFEKINQLSFESGHPVVNKQIGWARVELHEDEKYILIDEIQTDHASSAFKIKNISSKSKPEEIKLKQILKEKYSLNEEELNKILTEYHQLFKDFAFIAGQAITEFAKQNGFTKLFWHTYESGKKLKKNDPPKSLYDKAPKDLFFSPSQEKPFNLPGEFFERTAQDSCRYRKRILRRLLLLT